MIALFYFKKGVKFSKLVFDLHVDQITKGIIHFFVLVYLYGNVYYTVLVEGHRAILTSFFSTSYHEIEDSRFIYLDFSVQWQNCINEKRIILLIRWS